VDFLHAAGADLSGMMPPLDEANNWSHLKFWRCGVVDPRTEGPGTHVSLNRDGG
jgi:hypothetical protein